MKNLVILIGNVGADPEIKHLETSSVANFTLATTERGYKTSSGREIPERTDWHRIIVWGGLAKVVESYVKKGSQIYIEGKIRNREYTDNSGNRRFITEVYADNLVLLGGKPRQAETTYTETPTYQTQQSATGVPEREDDLPF